MALCLWSNVSPRSIEGADRGRMPTSVDRFEEHLILTVPFLFPRIGKHQSDPQRATPRE